MCFYVSVVLAAILALLGFGAVWVSDRAGGHLQGVLRMLGIWLFVIALVPLAGGVYFAISGTCTLGDDKRGQIIRERWERKQMEQMREQMPGEMPGETMDEMNQQRLGTPSAPNPRY